MRTLVSCVLLCLCSRACSSGGDGLYTRAPPPPPFPLMPSPPPSCPQSVGVNGTYALYSHETLCKQLNSNRYPDRLNSGQGSEIFGDFTMESIVCCTCEILYPNTCMATFRGGYKTLYDAIITCDNHQSKICTPRELRACCYASELSGGHFFWTQVDVSPPPQPSPMPPLPSPPSPMPPLPSPPPPCPQPVGVDDTYVLYSKDELCALPTSDRYAASLNTGLPSLAFDAPQTVGSVLCCACESTNLGTFMATHRAVNQVLNDALSTCQSHTQKICTFADLRSCCGVGASTPSLTAGLYYWTQPYHTTTQTG